MTDQAAPTPPSSPASSSTNSPAPEPVLRFAQIWADSLAQVLGQVAGSAFPMELAQEAPPGTAPAEETDVPVILVAAGGLRGEMSLRLPRTAALAAAQLFLSEKQDGAAEFKPDHREALEELLRQVAGHVATALKPHWGEVQLRLEQVAAPSWSAGASGWFAAGAGSACPLAMEWKLSAALTAALAATHPAEANLVEPSPASTLPEANFELLKDAELEVTLRFGECSMLLRDILELGEGSVVELDRHVQEPVDLLLDGKLIARGEVVVVDGNYGLRVQEIVGPMATA